METKMNRGAESLRVTENISLCSHRKQSPARRKELVCFAPDTRAVPGRSRRWEPEGCPSRSSYLHRETLPCGSGRLCPRSLFPAVPADWDDPSGNAPGAEPRAARSGTNSGVTSGVGHGVPVDPALTEPCAVPRAVPGAAADPVASLR